MRSSFLVAAATVAALASPGDSLAAPPDRSFLTESEHAWGVALPDDLRDNWALRGASYGYDVEHVHLDMAVTFGPNAIDATSTLTVRITDAGLTALVVDLDDALTVTSVTIDGAPQIFSHVGETVSVTLLSSPAVDDIVDIAVSYNGLPSIVGNKSMRFSSHAGTPLMFTLSTPFSTAGTTVIPVSHYWRACKDVPDDKSTYSCALTVPDTMTGVSNGLMTGSVDNGDGTKTFDWQHDYPVAPYLITVGVTNYVEIADEYVGPGGSSPIRHYAWPEDLADATSDWAVTKDQMAVFADRFGEYPFIGDKFGNYETFGGPAVEHQTAVSTPSSVVTGTGTFEWLNAHEIAHMWWGDCLTVADWDHVWLAEGMASYSEAIWEEDSGGLSALRSYMLAMDSGPYASPVVTPNYVWSSVVYDKGAWIFHMLRRILGDADFFQMLRDWRSAHEFGNVVTDDLVAAAEAAYGGDLAWFFDPWVYEVGRPEYEYLWSSAPALTGGGFDVTIDLEQVQDLALPTYTMPIDVEITTASGVESFVVTNSTRSESFVLTVSDVPTDVALDPDSWVLADFTETVVGVGSAGAGWTVALEAPRPNPMQAATTLAVDLDRDTRIALRIFDAGGRLVRTLATERRPAGRHEWVWDGRDRHGRDVATGTYFARLVSTAGAFEQSILVVR